MSSHGVSSRFWTWGMITLAGLTPFALDMLRNFQLFTFIQLAWSGGAILAATSGMFLLSECLVTIVRRFGPPLFAQRASWIHAGMAAIIFAIFMMDTNLTELRLDLGWSLPLAGVAMGALFILYWGVAAGLGAKRTVGLLLLILVFRAGQTVLTLRSTALRGDELTSAEDIAIYEQVALARTPHIYLICLESYHGFEAMQDLYGFANAGFRAFLEQHGFVVSPRTLSNYSFTTTSLQSQLQMGHHYAAGTFGNHDSLYARGFMSGSGTYYNPVLQILKRNGYDLVYLLPSDYYYRPGAGLVDHSLLKRSWPLAPLKASLPRLIGREPNTLVPDYEAKVAAELAAWPLNTPAFFFIKLGAEHSKHDYDYRTARTSFVSRYVETVRRENPIIEHLCKLVMARDPQGIIILAGDHGAQSYRSPQRGFATVLREDGISADRLVRDCHDVLLAIRWGDDPAPPVFPYHSLANVMRFVFMQLGGGEELLQTEAADAAYLLDWDGLRLVADHGSPLEDWPLIPRRGWR